MGSTPKKLSASRMSSAMGINPFRSRIDLWLDIMQEEFPGYLESKGILAPEKKPAGSALKLGLAFENAIMDYVGLSGEREKYFADGIHTAHVDSYETSGKSPYISEIKTTSGFVFREKFGEENTDQIPPEYIVQVNQQMWLSDTDYCVLYVLVFPDSQDKLEKLGILETSYSEKIEIIRSLDSMGFLKTYKVIRDELIIGRIKKIGSRFWKSIEKKKPPRAHNITDVQKILLPVSGECLATPEIVEKVKWYNYVNKEFNRMKKEKEKVAGELLKYMNTHCQESKTGKMVIKNNRGFNVASYNKRLSVNKEKER